MSTPRRDMLASYGGFIDAYRAHLERDGSNAHGGLNGEHFLEELRILAPRLRADVAALVFYQGAQFHRLAVVQELTRQSASMLDVPLKEFAVSEYFDLSSPWASPIAAAEHLYRSAISLQRDWSPAHFNLGTILFRRGEMTAAKQEFSLVGPECGPLSAYAHWYQAMISEKEGSEHEANAHYLSAVSGERHFGPMHRRAADFFRRNGQFDEALKHYEIALRFSYPPAPEFLFTDFIAPPPANPLVAPDLLVELMRSKGFTPARAQ